MRRPKLLLDNPTCLTKEEHKCLQRHFEEKEILDSIKLCEMEKARGSDGFPMSFLSCLLGSA